MRRLVGFHLKVCSSSFVLPVLCVPGSLVIRVHTEHLGLDKRNLTPFWKHLGTYGESILFMTCDHTRGWCGQRHAWLPFFPISPKKGISTAEWPGLQTAGFELAKFTIINKWTNHVSTHAALSTRESKQYMKAIWVWSRPPSKRLIVVCRYILGTGNLRSLGVGVRYCISALLQRSLLNSLKESHSSYSLPSTVLGSYCSLHHDNCSLSATKNYFQQQELLNRYIRLSVDLALVNPMHQVCAVSIYLKGQSMYYSLST